MKLVPVSHAVAKTFVAQYHRHNGAPVGMKFCVGLEVDGELAGVAIAGRPVARELDDGLTLEVTRVCTMGARNGCSILYGAIKRAAWALGYRKLVTYTLSKENGASLKAAGFDAIADVVPKTWNMPGRHRYQKDLFGADRRPPGPKIRWQISKGL